jgi:hypothetical protein
MENIQEAQHDMRVGYSNGYSGVIVSGLVWLVAGLVAIYATPMQAVWTLLIGGMFIHPIGIIVNKIIGASGEHARNNPLGRLAMEGTVFMIMCLPLAYGLSLQNASWFFQAMLLIIGGRYLTFATLFGTRMFWVLGAALGIAAYLLFTMKAPVSVSALTGSAIEIGFGFSMLLFARKSASMGN